MYQTIIVKLEKYYLGEIFVQDNCFISCKFDTYNIKMNNQNLNFGISENFTNNELQKLFRTLEDEFNGVHGLTVHIYRDRDLYEISQEIIDGIADNYVKRSCRKWSKQFLWGSDRNDFVNKLNLLLLNYSQLSKDEIFIH